MDVERIKKIEIDIESSGGINNYISDTYNSPEKVSDLSFYINNSIKSDIISKCNICELTDINNILDSIYPILTISDAEKVINAIENNTPLDRNSLESYLSHEDIKQKILSVPNSCIQCFKSNSSNTKLNNSRTCVNTYGIQGVPATEAMFNCPNDYAIKSNVSTITCPDQNDCNKDLCCDPKNMQYYMKNSLPTVMLFCIIVFIITVIKYLLNNNNNKII